MNITTSMIEAHVQHELQLMTGQALEDSLSKELGAVWQWLNTATLETLIPLDLLKDGLSRNLIQQKQLPDYIKQQIQEGHGELQAILKEMNATINTLVSRQIFEGITAQTPSKTEMRRKLIHQFVNSAVYVRLLSEVLYSSTKNFLVNENPLAKKIPGASRFLEFGKNLVNQKFAGLEGNVEKVVKEFIERQLQESIKQSERFLNQGMDSELANQWRDEIWKQISNESLAELMELLGQENTKEAVQHFESMWQHWQNNGLLEKVVFGMVERFYAKQGSRSIASLLEDLGLDEARFVGELKLTLSQVIAQVVKSGLFEQRIRERLQSFYNSTAAQDLLNAGA